MKKIFFAALLIIVIALIFVLGGRTDLAPGLKNFGVTFSQLAAADFGLDWKKVYSEILDDLKVRNLRLPAYWTEIEKNQGQYSFADLDWQVAEAEKRGAKIILAVGQRLPRWPECHIPEWVKNLPVSERQEKLLKVIGLIVNRYKPLSSIEYWQVENEPFLSAFGRCPSLDKNLLDKELALVRSLDARPIIVTDSGELSIWLQAARRADIFGTTMYRTVWNPKLPGSGYLHYPLPPGFFHFKANFAKLFSKIKDIIVVELQAEPWGMKTIREMLPEERDVSLSIEQFKENIEYAREVGFREAYLWGAEWWYWEKLNGRPEFWNYAKTLFLKH